MHSLLRTMDAVPPLTLRDLDRSGLLFDSLEQRFRGIGTLWVDPAPSCSGTAGPRFVVVQFNTAIRPHRVRAKLARYAGV